MTRCPGLTARNLLQHGSNNTVRTFTHLAPALACRHGPILPVPVPSQPRRVLQLPPSRCLAQAPAGVNEHTTKDVHELSPRI